MNTVPLKAAGCDQDATASSPARRIAVVAGILWDGERFLAVERPEGKPQAGFWEFPGGKIEPGETPADALARELREELGVALRPESALALGTFEDEAVNEPGRRVQGESFLVRVDGTPRAQAEIAELAWIPLRPPHGVKLAPLSERHVLPMAARQPL